MYIKIYFDDKPLFIANKIDREISKYAGHDETIFMDELSAAGISSMIHEMNQEKVQAGIFLHDDVAAVKKMLWKEFKIVLAGGGLVLNELQQPLFIFRRGKWDLPKGKLDAGESIQECALREVQEETGLLRVKLGEPLTTSFHTYNEKGKQILKESHWFNMTGTTDDLLVPQLDEQITSIKWVERSAMAEIIEDTYPSILDVLTAANLSL